MLANQLPGVRSQGYVNNGLMVEALAFSLMASYSTTGWTARSNLSFARAFAMTTSRLIPRVVNSTPGFIIAKIDDGSTRGRLHVAIEGTTNIRQWWTWTNGDRAVGITGCAGYVWSPPAVYANDIKAILLTDPSYLELTANNANAEIVFSGHSLGGSVSEILAHQMQAAYPHLRCFNVKFSAPKVGNMAWIQGRSRQVMRRYIRMKGDPVHRFPDASFSWTSTNAYALPTGAAGFYLDPCVESLDVNGDMQAGYWNDDRIGFAAALQGCSGPATHENQWSRHYIKALRRAMMFHARQWHNLDTYRFNKLELPDEWSEQNNSSQRVGWDDFNYNLEGHEGPAAWEVPPQLMANYVAIPNTASTYAGDTGDSGIGGGGDWGDAAPAFAGPFAPPAENFIIPRRIRRAGVR